MEYPSLQTFYQENEIDEALRNKFDVMLEKILLEASNASGQMNATAITGLLEGPVTLDGNSTLLEGSRQPSKSTVTPRWLGRYEALGLIGEGGMGEVHRVRDPVLNRTLALKILHVNRMSSRHIVLPVAVIDILIHVSFDNVLGDIDRVGLKNIFCDRVGFENIFCDRVGLENIFCDCVGLENIFWDRFGLDVITSETFIFGDVNRDIDLTPRLAKALNTAQTALTVHVTDAFEVRQSRAVETARGGESHQKYQTKT